MELRLSRQSRHLQGEKLIKNVFYCAKEYYIFWLDGQTEIIPEQQLGNEYQV